MARRAQIRSHERQIVIGCIEYSTDMPQREWPLDMPTLTRWSQGDLDDKLFHFRWVPDIGQPLLYIRPTSKASADQPVLISDPACDSRKAVMVCYADGHTAQIAAAERAEAVWSESKRLAASPKAKAGGIELLDWKTLKEPR